jgi:hypothetical protein
MVYRPVQRRGRGQSRLVYLYFPPAAVLTTGRKKTLEKVDLSSQDGMLRYYSVLGITLFLPSCETLHNRFENWAVQTASSLCQITGLLFFVFVPYRSGHSLSRHIQHFTNGTITISGMPRFGDTHHHLGLQNLCQRCLGLFCDSLLSRNG